MFYPFGRNNGIRGRFSVFGDTAKAAVKCRPKTCKVNIASLIVPYIAFRFKATGSLFVGGFIGLFQPINCYEQEGVE